MLLVLGAALASNCGGGSDGPGSTGNGGMDPGSAGEAGEPGEPGEPGSGGASGGAATSAGGSGDAGNAPTAGSGEVAGGASGVAGEGGAAGESDAGGQGGGGAGGVSICPESLVDYPKLYAEAICRKRVQCCADQTDTCIAQVSEGLAKVYPELAKSEQEGTAVANCQALEQCLAAVDAAECSAWPLEMAVIYGVPAGEPACRDIIKGKLTATKPCASTYQCDNGICAGDPTTTCIALAADGETCGGDAICNLATSYCSASSSKCVPREPNGAACASGDECMSRRCDTQDTKKCLAPASDQCKFVPEQACSFGRGPLRNNLAWSLLVMGLALGVAVRRRSRERA